MNWRVFHKPTTVSTNLDAASGVPGDIFTADFQSAGRGRLDHKWVSRRGENLMMSAVLDVAGAEPERAATLPLAVGLAVADALSGYGEMKVKWPNDVLSRGRKVAGILCERHGDSVVAGIGVNVRQTRFPDELSERATSVALLLGVRGETAAAPEVEEVRDKVLSALSARYEAWRKGGLAAIAADLAAVDFLKGRRVEVAQTDDDGEPVVGICGGIAADGALVVGGTLVYAGEAHVLAFE